MRRARLHEIDYEIEELMQLAQMTKQVTLLAIQGTPNKEQCRVCSTLGNFVNACLYQREAIVGPEQVNAM